MKGAFALLLWALLCVGNAYASEVELPGLLINETQTNAGRDFYAAFTAVWPSLDPNGTYTLVIHEKPSVRTGSQITVKYAGRIVFQSFIGVNGDKNKALAHEAAAQVVRLVGGLRPDVQHVMQQLFPDPDMAPDEIQL